MYKRTFICPDDLEHPMDISFRDHSEFEQKTDLAQADTKCLCCQGTGHIALVQVASPFVAATHGRNIDGHEWVGRDFTAARTRIEAGQEPPRPIAGIADRDSIANMIPQGIDPGRLLAYKGKDGKLSVDPGLTL